MAPSKPPSQSVQVVKAKYASSLNSEPTDRALLIGIQYSQSNFHHPLTQSHNDVALMKDALICESLLFTRKNIVVNCHYFRFSAVSLRREQNTSADGRWESESSTSDES